MKLIAHTKLSQDFDLLHRYILKNYSIKYADAFEEEYSRIYNYIADNPFLTRSLSLHNYYEAAVFANSELENIRYKDFSDRFINALYHFPDGEFDTNYILALLTTTVGEQFFVDTLSTREQTKQVA
jgi:hypothetical protein